MGQVMSLLDCVNLLIKDQGNVCRIRQLQLQIYRSPCDVAILSELKRRRNQQ